jgi:uncharacterized protein DUF732
MWSVAVRVLIPAMATSLMFAAPASADSAGYLQALVPTYNLVSPQQLLSEGAKVCSAIDSGMNATDAVQMVQKDLGVSIPASGDIVSAAVVHLGC